MARDLDRWEQERDDYDAAMADHADLLGIYRQAAASGIEVVCERHNYTVPFGTLTAECRTCLDEFDDLRRQDRYWSEQ